RDLRSRLLRNASWSPSRSSASSSASVKRTSLFGAMGLAPPEVLALHDALARGTPVPVLDARWGVAPSQFHPLTAIHTAASPSGHVRIGRMTIWATPGGMLPAKTDLTT